MCFSYPAQVLTVDGLSAQIDIRGTVHEVLLTIEVIPGDWVLVTAGSAIARIDADHAREMISLMEPYMQS